MSEHYNPPNITASFLQSVYTHPVKGRTLHRSKITDFGLYDTFPAFVDDFLTAATMPAPATNKGDAYGWAPTLFELRPDPRDASVIGERKGAYALDTVSLFVADLDNQHDDRTMIDIATVETTLTNLGLSFLLYTSFSHTVERHKVRIVCPISRDMTTDEAFRVFLWFNAAFDRQLDGSVYDLGDFLYGPALASDIRVHLTGDPLEVDAFLMLHDQLSEGDRTCVPRSAGGVSRAVTVEDEAKAQAMAAITVVSSPDITITNPAIFNPAWFELLTNRYQGGSRSRTLRGLIAKVWVKSAGTLTIGDLWTLYRELDAHYGGYCLRAYGRTACGRDIRSAMAAVGTATVAPTLATTTDQRIEKELARLQRRRA